MKIGSLLEKVFKYTGVKWLVKKVVIDLLGYESCGCEKRRDALDSITFNRNE